MRIKTAADINARTHDGREFVADEGSIKEIDGDDYGMVGLARSLILSGQAVHYGDAGTVDEELTDTTLEAESDDEELVMDTNDDGPKPDDLDDEDD